MEVTDPAVFMPIIAALAAGGAIGFEREFRARAAGFRTHILVAVSSAILMLSALHQVEWMGPYADPSVIRIDPVRMAHGILTGVGFLCGGVIFREGLSVHGLTTAASLWITSALGIVFGVGLYAIGAVGVVLTLVVLTVFRLVDDYLPSRSIAEVRVRFRRAEAPTEDEFEVMLGQAKVRKRKVAHRLMEGGQVLEYATSVQTLGALSVADLTKVFCADPRIVEYAIEPRDG